jgi:hypothetical protein
MSGGGSAIMKAEKLWWRCKMRHFAGIVRTPHNAEDGPACSSHLDRTQGQCIAAPARCLREQKPFSMGRHEDTPQIASTN